jgi:hypothetical protein
LLDATGLNTQRKVVDRKQDSQETEREGERGRALLEVCGGIGNKFGHWQKYL